MVGREAGATTVLRGPWGARWVEDWEDWEDWKSGRVEDGRWKTRTLNGPIGIDVDGKDTQGEGKSSQKWSVVQVSVKSEE